MGIGRNLFLWASRNAALRDRLPRYRFVQRSVSRFMPGETIEDALNAAEQLKGSNLSTVLTHLGENVQNEQETCDVRDHYLELLQKIHERALNAQISIKLTELGLDQNPQLCYNNVETLLQSATAKNNFVWIDMEGSRYTTPTLDLYRQIKKVFPNTGVCLQSYLYRTREDLNGLLDVLPGIRLVKGAYAEPDNIAYASKAENDENYFKLARTLLEQAGKDRLKIGFGTHDQSLTRRILEMASALNVSPDRFEIQMLYGIRTADQIRLVQQGFRVRVLISYGTFWFPWYMRRLAERPANVLFVMKNLFA